MYGSWEIKEFATDFEYLLMGYKNCNYFKIVNMYLVGSAVGLQLHLNMMLRCNCPLCAVDKNWSALRRVGLDGLPVFSILCCTTVRTFFLVIHINLIIFS